MDSVLRSEGSLVCLAVPLVRRIKMELFIVSYILPWLVQIGVLAPNKFDYGFNVKSGMTFTLYGGGCGDGNRAGTFHCQLITAVGYPHWGIGAIQSSTPKRVWMMFCLRFSQIHDSLH